MRDSFAIPESLAGLHPAFALSIPLDIDEYRVQFLGELEFMVGESQFTVGGCGLDTGLTGIEVLGPQRILEEYDFLREHTRKAPPVNSVAGPVGSLRMAAQLRLGHPGWVLPVSVRLVKQERGWWIGLPVLKNFSLLLRDVSPFIKPAICGPRLLL